MNNRPGTTADRPSRKRKPQLAVVQGNPAAGDGADADPQARGVWSSRASLPGGARSLYATTSRGTLLAETFVPADASQAFVDVCSGALWHLLGLIDPLPQLALVR